MSHSAVKVMSAMMVPIVGIFWGCSSNDNGGPGGRGVPAIEDSKGTNKDGLSPDTKESKSDKAVSATALFPKVPSEFASVSVKASFLPVPTALAENEVNLALEKIAKSGRDIHAVKKDDKGRINSCIIVGSSIIETTLGKAKGLEVARLRARHAVLASFSTWLSTTLREYKDSDKSTKYVSSSEIVLPVLELLHTEVDEKDKLYTLVLGWDARRQEGKRPKLKIDEESVVEELPGQMEERIRRVLTCTLPSADKTVSVLDPEFTIARSEEGNYRLARLWVRCRDNGVGLRYEEYRKQGAIEQAREDDVTLYVPKSRFGKGIVLAVDGVDQADIARKWSSMVKGQLPKEGVSIANFDGRLLSLDTISKENFNEFGILVKTKMGLELRLEDLK